MIKFWDFHHKLRRMIWSRIFSYSLNSFWHRFKNSIRKFITSCRVPSSASIYDRVGLLEEMRWGLVWGDKWSILLPSILIREPRRLSGILRDNPLREPLGVMFEVMFGMLLEVVGLFGTLGLSSMLWSWLADWATSSAVIFVDVVLPSCSLVKIKLGLLANITITKSAYISEKLGSAIA